MLRVGHERGPLAALRLRAQLRVPPPWLRIAGLEYSRIQRARANFDTMSEESNRPFDFSNSQLLWARKMDRYEELWHDGVEAFRRGEYSSAADKFQVILQYFRCDAEALDVAHRYRGLCFQLQGDYPRAILEFEQALSACPQSLQARDRLAYLLATTPHDTLRDGVRARSLAEFTAAQPHEQQWASLTILAAAEAELGDFDSAVATYERAMRIMPQPQREKSLERLEQLRAGQPLRCSPEYDRLGLLEFRRANWRQNVAHKDYLHGLAFHRAPYHPSDPTWNHEHCEFCWRTFVESDSRRDVLHEGWTDVDREFYWICEECFQHFKIEYEWKTPT